MAYGSAKAGGSTYLTKGHMAAAINGVRLIAHAEAECILTTTR